MTHTQDLQASIAEVKRVTKIDDEAGQGGRWNGWDFTNQQDAHDPTPVDDAIATILNAVVCGALVPAPAVPDDVAGLVAELRADAEMHQDLLPDRAADALEGMAAELALTKAENARLRDALRDILDAGGQFGSAAHMRNVDRIARAALQPTGDA